MAAESIVSCLVGKLADAVVNEVLFLHGVGEKVESMKKELERMQCFLKDADMKRNGDARVQGWVNDVRCAAFRIEDAIDTFIAEIARINCRNKIKRMLTRPEKIIAQHKLGKELDAINLLIAEIAKSRFTYGINNLGEGSGSEVGKPVRPIVIPDIDETEVVGFEADKEFIIGQLLDPNTLRRSVVSIVGQGGLGKTTLAVKAYKSLEVPKHFDIKIWVAVSKDFTLIDLVKRMLHQANFKEDEYKDKELRDLITKLNMFLKGKKYIIVLDDVWTNDLWTQIAVIFPDVKNGSRVLITSRLFDVVKMADPINDPHKLPFLNENDSRDLFLKNALFGKKMPSDLNDLSIEFSKKCRGLPLALVVLGRFLSIKPLTFHYWSGVLKQMKWKDIAKNCMEIIVTSYEDLPPVLKSCFMYFASFPEDHKIEAKSLIRMWVAEGFIPEKKHRTMEETAHDYLENLVERSMVQVAKRNYNGSIKYCRMHDLLRDLAIQKAEEDNFLMVYPNGDSHNGSDKARRVAVHYPDCEELIKVTNPNVRSLLRSSQCYKKR